MKELLHMQSLIKNSAWRPLQLGISEAELMDIGRLAIDAELTWRTLDPSSSRSATPRCELPSGSILPQKTALVLLHS
jgi:hypothetical protein